MEDAKEEISQLRLELEKLPRRDDCDETNLTARRELQRKLELAEFRFAEQEELERIEDGKRRAVDLGLLASLECVEPDRLCPICLVNISLRRTILRAPCCGAIQCYRCVQRGRAVTKMPCCPFCRYDKWEKIQDHLYREAIEGKTWAQLLLGTQLRNGENGFEKDHSQAQQWFALAADQGNAKAMLALADLRQMGFPQAIPPVPPDQELADEYVALAAKHGSAEAQYRMACRNEPTPYEHTMIDEITIIWNTLSAGQGYHMAQCALGEAYMYGDFGEENAFKSIYWLRKAAVQGWGPAQLQLSHQLPHAKALIYDGQSDVPGYSAIPEASFWYDKYEKSAEESQGKVSKPEL
jgi:Sel1 repeat